MASTSDSTRYWKAIVPSDATVLVETNYLYVGTTGNLVATVVDPITGVVADVTFNNLAVGYHPIKCTKVKAATTASQIIGAW